MVVNGETAALAADESTATSGREADYLRFTDVRKSYDQEVLVVKGSTLDVARGEFITLLGPSGSGKTTMLMMLAGFESVTSGEIRIDGVPMTRTPPYRRNIGMVFQNYALFPHMTVAQNLAYPLKARKIDRATIDQRVKEYLELVELAGYNDRYPGQLSGGQRQRIALARALIFEPSLVLMDEPLGALDRKLREQMEVEITRLHRKLGFTVIYVTHDQSEALTMSDRIAVFSNGVVQQCASPDVLYEQPANAFVADFIGENNFIPGRLGAPQSDGHVPVELAGGATVRARLADAKQHGTDCTVAVRPEKLFIAPAEGTYDNRISAKFNVRHYVGDFIRYYFHLDDGSEIVVKMLNDLNAPMFEIGATTTLAWQAKDCFAFEPLHKPR